MSYPTVNFQPTSSFMGLQPIGIASATQAHVLGTVVRARDVSYGEGEFIYLAGVASTAAGDAVSFDSKTGITTRATTASIGAIGIAMAATIAGQFGWYQISGSGPVNAATTVANTQAYLTATPGQIDDTGSTALAGLTISAATVAGFATVQLERPSVSAGGGGGGSVTFAPVGSVPNSAGASISGSTVTLQPANATNPGVVTTGTQSFAGDKTFTGNIAAVYGTFSNAVFTSSNVSAAGFQPYTAAQAVALIGTAPDSASAVSTYINHSVALTTTGAKLLSVRNNGTEVAYIDKAGSVSGSGSFMLDGAPVVTGSGGNTVFVARSVGTAGIVYLSNQAGHFATVSSAGVEVLSSVTAGFILRSPDGTRYRIQVANGGVLSTTAAP